MIFDVKPGDRIKCLDDGPYHGMNMGVLKVYPKEQNIMAAIHLAELGPEQQKYVLEQGHRPSADGMIHYLLSAGEFEVFKRIIYKGPR